MSDIRERFDTITRPIRPALRTRVLACLWRRDIDPETAGIWTAVFALITSFWTVVGWAIWRVLQ